jgi:hypothetical protein
MLGLVVGSIMAQSALVEFLLKQKIIESGPLLEHLAAKRVSWEATADASALWAIDTISAIAAGRQPPAPPGKLH